MTSSLDDIVYPDGRGVLTFPRALRLVPPWRELLSDVNLEVKRTFGVRFHSLYVRGSVAFGTQVLNVSDLDVLCVLRGHASDSDEILLERVSSSCAKSRPWCSRIELAAYYLDELLSAVEYGPQRFVVKVLSRCVDGDDLCDDIHEFMLNRVPFLCLPQLADSLNVLGKYVEGSSGFMSFDARLWIAKRLIRAAFEFLHAEYSRLCGGRRSCSTATAPCRERVFSACPTLQADSQLPSVGNNERHRRFHLAGSE